MLLAIAPLGVLFVLAAGTFGAMMFTEYLDRRVASKTKGKAKGAEEGDIVSSQFVDGSDWVVKVYKTHGQFEVQVIYLGEFQTRKTGFGTPELAEGWGVSYAKQHGA